MDFCTGRIELCIEAGQLSIGNTDDKTLECKPELSFRDLI